MQNRVEMNMNMTFLSQVRSGGWVTKLTSYTLIVCYLSVFYTPAAKAIQFAYEQGPLAVDQNILRELDEGIGKAYAISERLAKGGADTAEARNSKVELLSTLDHVLGFDETIREVLVDEQDIVRWEAATELLREHRQRLAMSSSETQPVTASGLRAVLAPWKSLKQHRVFDSNMPFGPQISTVRAPFSDAMELQSLLGSTAKVSGGLAKNTASNIPTKLGTLFSSETNSISVKTLAATTTSTAPVASDLAANEDAQLTAAIRAKAAELKNDPVAIFNWVYSKIEFVPSHGSIQGADYTLQSLRGNATDTSSLLIALLRAADIPARYRYGTIWLTPSVVQNWVGGVDTAEAAQNLLSQGGVPNVRVFTTDGEYFKIEHTWVEAYGVFPTQPESTGSPRWQALDASLKQYRYATGMNLAKAVPFDGERVASRIVNSSEKSNAEGWVRNIDGAYLQSEVNSYRKRVEDFFKEQTPNSTVEEVLGGRRIVERNVDTYDLHPSYERIDVSAALSTLPDGLRHKFKFELLSDSGSVLFSFTRSTPQLAGKSLALSFSPATTEDETRLRNVLPAASNSDDELPVSLPAGLIKLKAEFSLDGVMQLSHTSHGLGAELQTRKGFWAPRNGWELTTNPVIAGEYQAIGLDLQGLSHKQVEQLRNGLEITKAKVGSGALTGLTKHDVTGAILQAGMQGYLLLTRTQSELSAQVGNIVYYREPSYGTFSTSLSVDYFLGTPRRVNFDGVLMDVDRVASNVESRINCFDEWRDFNLTNGSMLSTFEHIVPEMLFSSPTKRVEGISAIKALAVANLQGQRTYSITGNNLDGALAAISADESTKDEIREAISSGLAVTIHQEKISYNGWSGFGYVVSDIETGGGAYKISGGADGGFAEIENDISSLVMAGMGSIDEVAERIMSLLINVFEFFDSLMNCPGTSIWKQLAVYVAFLAALAVIMWAMVELIAVIGVAAGLTVANATQLGRVVTAIVALLMSDVLSVPRFCAGP